MYNQDWDRRQLKEQDVYVKRIHIIFYWIIRSTLLRSVTLNKSIDEVFAFFFDRLYIPENGYSNMNFAFKSFYLRLLTSDLQPLQLTTSDQTSDLTSDLEFLTFDLRFMAAPPCNFWLDHWHDLWSKTIDLWFPTWSLTLLLARPSISDLQSLNFDFWPLTYSHNDLQLLTQLVTRLLTFDFWLKAVDLRLLNLLLTWLLTFDLWSSTFD